MSKYDRLMEKIEVTEGARNRILSNIGKKEKEEITKPAKIIQIWNYKAYLPFAVCFVAILLGLFTIPNIIKNDSETPESEVTTTPNILEANSVEVLSENVGFPVSDIPLLASEEPDISYISIGKELAEIQYRWSDQCVVFRKSVGEKDNSGDYTEYESVREKQFGAYKVTLKGNGGNYHLAIWADGEFAYSLYFKNPVSEQELERIITEIK